MQASRTAHYAWLYRGSRASRIAPSSQAASSQGHGWSGDVAPKAGAAGALGAAASASPLRPRVSPLSRSRPDGRDLPAEAGVSAAMARSHFIEAQIRSAVQSGIGQMVWLGPRATQTIRTSNSLSFELGVEVEVFRLEEDALRGTNERGSHERGERRKRAARAVLDRSLVRSARTLFVCDGLFDRSPAAQIQAILRTIGDSCFGSRLACLYLDRGLSSGNLAFGGSHKPQRAVPRLGEPTEPTQLGLEMRALPGLLACTGLVLDADVGLSEYVRRFQFLAPAAASDLRNYGCCRLLAAHVRAPAVADVADRDPLN
jgi:hypothetical protein